jgi:hypothetical protein
LFYELEGHIPGSSESFSERKYLRQPHLKRSLVQKILESFPSMTTSLPGLEALLERIGLDVPVPPFPGADILNKPIDIYLSYLADLSSKLLECDADLAFGAVQKVAVDQTGNGDLNIRLPKLKLQERDVAGELIKGVR